MNTKKVAGSALGLMALAALVASQALAGTCSSRIRTYPASSDRIDLTCKHGQNGALTKGTLFATNQGGTKLLSANLTQGPAAGRARAIGMNNAGVALANCTASDSTADGSSGTAICSAAVKWAAQIDFAE